MSVTIKDIARIAGVSHSTVSRALRDHPTIAPVTIQRIKKLADDLGYVPSAVARGLKTKRSHALGVVVSRIDDPFFSEILQGIDDVLSPAGYSLFVAASNRDLQREKQIVQALGERRVDGMIVCSTHVSARHGLQLRKYGVPIVVVDNQATEDYAHSIYHDDRDGSRQLTAHLIDLGHRRIAYIGNRLAGRTTASRLAGYRQALDSARLTVRAGYVMKAPDGRPDGGMSAVRALLELPSAPTAIVCFNDLMAIGVIRELQNRGLRVPGDCSVVGFDNIDLSAFVSPPLTTFHQPKYELGHEAARRMLRLLDPDGDSDVLQPEILVLRGELLVRASTAPPGTRS